MHPPDPQIVNRNRLQFRLSDRQPPDRQASDCQRTHRERTNRQCADRGSAPGIGAHGNAANRDISKSSAIRHEPIFVDRADKDSR
jgi:hypothetical protein